jgi:hypothetical protein
MTTTTSTSSVPTSAYKPPLTQRINFRMIFFGAVVLFLIGSPVYIFLSEKLTGGVHNRGDYLEVDLKALSSFEMDQATATINDVPPQWRQLDSRRVMLVGEMWDARGAGDKVKTFQLCYSVAKCCFSGPPKVQHFVDSRVPDGKDVDYYGTQVRVLGTLRVNVKHEAGKVISVYQMDVESVEPA